ncbi:HSP20 family protein [Variovorax sp. TBS-050B]|jgi:HSP20 family molecular chaperone IbpA|uniref:Hsp20/alpha crystallin family protein n=1 Tax=Variovorax sp. TBS-050B TaxID=2940551 RepID=UPI002475ED58|nr:Hsp20/alpha crystallin family protein [Variovorax sp. TBS-050B]MDH6594977.1 HSP20 family protein [Variovorax sp. TBS-050B]
MNTTTSTTPSSRVADPQQQQQREVARSNRDGARYSDAALTPPVDVIEDSGGITLYADLPGVSREKLGLHVASDTLTIDAESDISVPEGLQSSHTEVGLARFRRVFTLSKELDTAAITAELSQGVLKLRIPKAEHAQPKRIEIQTA